MLWARRTTPVSARFSAAALLAVAAMALRAALNPFLGNAFPFVADYFAVLAAVRWCGAAPAVLAMALCAIGSPLLAGRIEWTRLAAFIVVNLATVQVVEIFRRARSQAEENAALAAERLSQLEQQTAQRKREERLSAQLRAIVESSEDAVLSKDLHGIIQSWNRAAERIFGYTEVEALGQSIGMLLPPDRGAEDDEIFERIRRGAQVKHFETMRVRKDGRQIQVALTASPIRDAAGAIIGISHISRDITEQKSLEEQLRQTQKLESLGVLAGGLAHDFNNLLTGIMGNASLAAEEAGSPERIRQRCGEILSASERAAMLIRQMLAYAGKGRFVVTRLDLSALIREILPLLRTSISRMIELELRLAPEVPRLEADPAQIQQLVMNLAINAAEAIGERPGTVSIATSSRQRDGEPELVLEVRDTGCGMDDATRARIFDPFFTTKFTGRGLGLSAVIGIIRQNRGSISVSSAPGQGSTFTVVFPACTAVSAEPQEGGYGTILVIDDEEMVRTMARFTLEHLGYSVEPAATGREALEVLAARPGEFAAVLVDLAATTTLLPDLLRRIRALRPDIPVIVTSSYSESDALGTLEDVSIAGFLQKPYTATALARRVAQAVRGAGIQAAQG
jgi:PAS domain S-box-containing protein